MSILRYVMINEVCNGMKWLLVCNDNDVECENGLRMIKKEIRVYVKWYSTNLKYNLSLNISSVHDAVVVI